VEEELKWNHNAETLHEMFGFMTKREYEDALEKEEDMESDFVFAGTLMAFFSDIPVNESRVFASLLLGIYDDQDLEKFSEIMELLTRAIKDRDLRRRFLSSYIKFVIKDNIGEEK